MVEIYYILLVLQQRKDRAGIHSRRPDMVTSDLENNLSSSKQQMGLPMKYVV